MDGGIDTTTLERGLFVRLIGSNILSTSLLYITYFVRPELWSAHIESTRLVAQAVAFFLGYAVFGIVLGIFISRRIFRPTKKWIETGAPDTSDEHIRVWRLPYVYATWSMVFWIGGMFVAPTIANLLWFDPGKLPIVRLEVSLALGGFLAFWFCYLLVEIRLRPIFAIASATAPPRVTRASSLATRLAFLWAASAGVPIVALTIIEIGLDPQKAYLARVTVWSLCGLTIVTGGVFTFIAGRRIVSDVMGVQRSMRRVADGDLDVRVDVDSPSELGHLQSGFNDMVAGLRERRTIEDLFGRHVGTEVARYALAQGTELRGETRDASVLFVDIVGSSRLAQSVPPTEVVKLLNEFFSTVVRVLASNGGWVNKFEGDGALGIFGAPADQPDHAARALRAARELRTELDALERANPHLRAAIGVSSGSVVAGNVGAAERYEYAVIGDPVNEASRVTDEAKTRSSKLLATWSAVRHGLEETSHWEQAGEVELRGREGSTRLYAPYA